jgi:broad specificity phosphatase PhoE
MRRTAFLLTLAALCSPVASLHAQTAAPTTIIFVRHAEAAGGNPRDPSLTPEGVERAQRLAKALESANVAAVYTSQYTRTRRTGELGGGGAPVTVVQVNGATLDADAATLVARIAREQPGRTVLVVGHSNTVPIMVHKAAGRDVTAIAEDEFDRLYIVTDVAGKPSLIQAKY